MQSKEMQAARQGSSPVARPVAKTGVWLGNMFAAGTPNPAVQLVAEATHPSLGKRQEMKSW
jgi:hypothetical protein